jgi:hypothetical protein
VHIGGIDHAKYIKRKDWFLKATKSVQSIMHNIEITQFCKGQIAYFWKKEINEPIAMNSKLLKKSKAQQK